MSHLNRRWDLGQGLVEYALILILVALAVVGALFLMGEGLDTFYADLVDTLQNIR